jgi:hypothetical protein
MAVFALASAGGSPGVTTAALALALGWPSQVVVAECDPSGGDVLAGLLSGHLPARTGLLPLALEAGGGAEVPAEALWRQLIELDEQRNCLLLAGISDPRQSAALQSSLPWIADALQGLKADVLADCGRLDAVAAVRPVLSAASLAVLVLRPTLRQVSRAVPRVEMLTNLVGRERVMTLLVGEGSASGREIARTLGVPVAGQLPDDPKTAAVLSDGLGSRRALDSRPLLRAATAAGRRLRDVAQAAGPRPGYVDETVFSVSGPHEQPSLDPYSGGQFPSRGLGLEAPEQDPRPLGGDRPGPDQPRFEQPRFDEHSFDEPPFDDPRFDEHPSDEPRFDERRAEQLGIGPAWLDQPAPRGRHAIGPRPPEFGLGPEPGGSRFGQHGMPNGTTPNGSTPNGHGSANGSGPGGPAQNGSRP